MPEQPIAERLASGVSRDAPVSRPLPSVVIVATGGTIAAHRLAEGSLPALTGEEILRSVPGLDRLATLRVVNFSNIDSMQMSPEIWARLSRRVDEELGRPEVVGCVVLHGTDTMAEAAYFLDLTLQSGKPVACVGAMRAASELSADGPANLFAGVVQVLSPKARDWGVTVTMNERVNAARYVRKTHTSNVATFSSGERGDLGYIGEGRVHRYQSGPPRRHFDLPTTLANVYLIATYAGTDGSLVRYAVDHGAEGIVIEGYGAGNVNEATFEAVRYALDQGVVVVVTSHSTSGPTSPAYASPGGGATLLGAGALLGGDLPAEKVRLLLMVALPSLAGDIERLLPFLS